LRVIRLESAYLLERLVPPGSVTEIHVLFPDPWPKKRHLDRRIIQPAFLQSVTRALIPGGRFRFATDHAEYFHSALPVIADCPGLAPLTPTESYPSTDFESVFRAEGKTIHDRVWQYRMAS
jgi:tRNA (guanine-N7-)-methyltransferase